MGILGRATLGLMHYVWDSAGGWLVNVVCLMLLFSFCLLIFLLLYPLVGLPRFVYSIRVAKYMSRVGLLCLCNTIYFTEYG